MSLIDLLDDQATWQDYYNFKLEKGHLNPRDEVKLADFIQTAAYRPIAQSIQSGTPLPPPQKILLNKLGTAKKRTVYTFDDSTMYTLKLLAWLLYCFDHKQPAGCYSFRRTLGAHRAFRDILQTAGINDMWCCKLDIRDYFNSIDVGLLLPILQQALDQDQPVYNFLEQLLTADVALHGDTLLLEKRGVMAGTPTAPFLANLYLGALDSHFTSQGLPYARYSDDIIIFGPDQTSIRQSWDHALSIINSHGLAINQEKAYISQPGELWEFLGMSYHSGCIDISTATKAKQKGKIRRKARALRRWMLRKQATPERTQRAFIRSINQKFFDSRNSNDLTWSRWFFPLITTSQSLREIDHYIQQYVRYIPTGRFNTASYQTDYADIKALGYRSLVHEFYQFKASRTAQQ